MSTRPEFFGRPTGSMFTASATEPRQKPKNRYTDGTQKPSMYKPGAAVTLTVSSGPGGGTWVGPALIASLDALQFDGGTHTLQDGFSATGPCTLSITSGTVQVGVAESATIENLTIGGGSIFLSPAGATLDVQSATAAMNDFWTGGSTLRSLGTLGVNSGTLTVSATDIDLASGSLLDGSGTISVVGAGSTTLNANIGSATTPQVLNLTGDWVPAGSPTVNITLDGTTPGTGAGSHGQFAVSGSATLTGTLNVTLAGGYSPQAGDSYTILTCGGTCSGTFTAENLPDLSGLGLVASVTYTGSAVVVQISSP